MPESRTMAVMYGIGAFVVSYIVCGGLYLMGFVTYIGVLFLPLVFLPAVFLVGRKLYSVIKTQASLKAKAIWIGILLPLLYWTYSVVVFAVPLYMQMLAA